MFRVLLVMACWLGVIRADDAEPDGKGTLPCLSDDGADFVALFGIAPNKVFERRVIWEMNSDEPRKFVLEADINEEGKVERLYGNRPTGFSREEMIAIGAWFGPSDVFKADGWEEFPDWGIVEFEANRGVKGRLVLVRAKDEAPMMIYTVKAFEKEVRRAREEVEMWNRVN